MDTLIGKTLSHYQIVEKIGEGGMGEVYRARDTRLGRDVAIKVLPADLADTPEARTRFEREARAISQINHPNICTLYDVGREGVTDFLVMELIAGGSLRNLLARKALPLDQVLDLGIQIADALEAAHARGIVHRDLKPGNILLTERGQAKVMDFGLATKFRRGARALGTSSTGATTEDEEHLTSPGQAVGTVAYMSPEQARSEEVDSRSDVFSLGAVLYEMASGHRAFEGSSTAVIFEAILNRTPPPASTLRQDVPEELNRIIGKALEKDRELRYQTAGDVRSDLRRLKRDLGSARLRTAAEGPRPTRQIGSAAGPRRRTVRRLIVPATLAVMAAVTVVTIRMLVSRGPSSSSPAKWRQITFTGNAGDPALSPDGKTIAYVLSEAEAPKRLMVQDIDGSRPVEIMRGIEPAGDQPVARWSPTGADLLFLGSRDSVPTSGLLPRMGGALRRMPWGPIRALSPDGSTIAYSWTDARVIRLESVAGTDTLTIRLAPAFTWLRDLDWSPNGESLLFLVRDPAGSSIWTVRRDGTGQRKVYQASTELSCPRWAPGGRAIYCVRWDIGGAVELLKIFASATSARSRTPPRVLLSEPTLGYHFALSADGRRLVCSRSSSKSDIWLWQRALPGRGGGTKPRQVLHSTTSVYGSVLSPDGARVAYVSHESGVDNIHVLSLRDGSTSQLTYMPDGVCDLCWSSNGQYVAFTAPDDDSVRIWIVDASGGAPARVRCALPSVSAGAIAWAPGREILYQRYGNRNCNIFDPVTQAERPLVSNDRVGWMFSPRWSPDQKHVSMAWNRVVLRAGKWLREPGLWVVSTADSTQRRLLRAWVYPKTWDRSGAGVLTLVGNRIVRISYPEGDTTTVMRIPAKSRLVDDYAWDMTPDLGTLVYITSDVSSDIWLVEHFDPEVK